MIGLRAPWGTSGGVEHSVAALAPRLVRRGCEVTVYCRGRYNPHGSGAYEGVQLVDVETLYTPHLEAFVHTARVAPLAARDADVVHIHAMGLLESHADEPPVVVIVFARGPIAATLCHR